MSAYKKLVKNSGIFAIANLGSKLMSILLVPFYTYILTTEQYGEVDIFITTISLLLPVITLNIFDATLRFSVKSHHNKKAIFTSSILIVLAGNLAFLGLILILLVLANTLINNEYIILFYIVILLQSINSTLAQFARGIGRVKSFALNGLISTFATLTLNIILLSKFNMGVRGYFISIVVANIVCNVYLLVSNRLWKYYDIKQYKLDLVKEMLTYSTPLIPNSLMWWIINASDRYIITLFLGIGANGIYSVANKIPTVLNLLNSIFSQAWQLSAIEEGESKDKSEFYTNVFKSFSTIMLMGTSAILIIVKPVVEIMLSGEFGESWRYVSFLLLAVVFSSFSTFLGTNYIAMKKTKGVFKTTVIGAVVNLILNIILIPTIGINGATIATMISYLSVWLIRIYDTKEFVNIKFDIKKIVMTLFIIINQIIILYYFDNISNILIQVVFFIINIFINRNVILEMIIDIIKVLKKLKR